MRGIRSQIFRLVLLLLLNQALGEIGAAESPATSPGALLSLQPLNRTNSLLPMGILRVSRRGVLVWGARPDPWIQLYSDSLQPDPSFRLLTNFPPDTRTIIRTAVELPDGQFLVARSSPDWSRAPTHRSVLKITANGLIDNSFQCSFGTVSAVDYMALLPDGKVMVAGTMRLPGSEGVSTLLRLNANGSLDTTYSPHASIGTGQASGLTSLPGGGLLVWGSFPGQPSDGRSRLRRLHPDGSWDPSFVPDLPLRTNSGTLPFYTPVFFATALDESSSAVLTDVYTSTPIPDTVMRILGPTGTTDPSFRTPRFVVPRGGSVNGILRERNGCWIVNGTFTAVNEQPRLGYARLSPSGEVDPEYTMSLPADFEPVGCALLEDDTLVVLGRSALALLAGGSLPSPPPVIEAQPSGRKARAGGVVNLSVSARSKLPTAFQWYHNGVALPQATNSSLVLRALRTAASGVYYVTVSNAAGSVTSDVAPVIVDPDPAAPGSADPEFGRNGFPDGEVRALQVDTAGKIYVGGAFTAIGSVPRLAVARLLPNGDPDPDYASNALKRGTANALLLQPDGRLLVGGKFDINGGLTVSNLVRLNSDGTRDASFNIGTGPAGNVLALAQQADGRLLIAGLFPAFDGRTARRCLTRLLPNGSPDPTFSVTIPANCTVSCVAVGPDHRIWIGGAFLQVNMSTRVHLACLAPDGSVDAAFHPGWGVEASNLPQCLLPLPDGGVMVGGNLSLANDKRLGGVAKFDSRGTLDSRFLAAISQDPRTSLLANVHAIASDGADGFYVAGFGLETPAGRASVARLNSDGSLDPSLSRGAADGVTPAEPELLAMAVAPDGALIVGGERVLGSLGGIDRPFLTRLHAGHGAPIVAGNNLGIPNLALVARGASGEGSPSDFTIEAGRDLVWACPAVSHEPVHYQWSLDGVPVPDATGPCLVLRNVGGAMTRTVEVSIGNSEGSSTLSRSYRVLPKAPHTGQPDLSFAAAAPINGKVVRVLPAADGSMIISGSMITIGGNDHRLLARLDRFGQPDPTWDQGWDQPDGFITELARQSDGKLLIGGDFIATNSRLARTSARLERLLPNGSPDSTFNIRLAHDAAISAIIPRQDGRILIGGLFRSVNAFSHTNLALLFTNGTPDETFQARVDGSVEDGLWLPDGRLAIVGDFQRVNLSPRARIALLRPDGSTDPSFVPGSGADAIARTVALHPDGSLIVGGSFTWIGDSFSPLVARVGLNGTVDPRFFAEIYGAGVVTAVVRPDGRIVVCGDLDSQGPTPRPGLAQLLSDGRLDPSFDPGRGFTYPTGDGSVAGLALEANGDLLAVGYFSHVNGTPRSRVARILGSLRKSEPPKARAVAYDYTARMLDSTTFRTEFTSDLPVTNQWWRVDGSETPIPSATNLDLQLPPVTASSAGVYQLRSGSASGSTSFAPSRLTVNPAQWRAGLPDLSSFAGPAVNGPVHAMAKVGSGHLWAGGEFTTAQNRVRRGLARWLPSGDLDDSFDPSLQLTGVTRCLVEDPARCIWVGGAWTTPNGPPRHLVRLRDDGSVDPSFAPLFDAEARILALAPTSEGGLLVGGVFVTVAHVARTNVARFAPTGALDLTFAPCVDGEVRCLAQQQDGSIWLGGEFLTVDGVPRRAIARLLANGTLDPAWPTSGTGIHFERVNAIRLRPSGGILLAGRLGDTDDGGTRVVLELEPDGSIGRSWRGYAPPGVPPEALDLVQEPDGALVVAGPFNALSGSAVADPVVARVGLARINVDGKVDLGFDPGTGPRGGSIHHMVLEIDGNLLISGGFTRVGDLARFGLARIIGTNPPVNTLSIPPRFSPPTGLSLFVTERNEIVFTNVVIDPDTPATGLRFALGDGAPDGLQFGTREGVIRWVPSENQGPGTYSFTILVRDDSVPPNEAARTVTLVVREGISSPLWTEVPTASIQPGEVLRLPMRIEDPDFPRQKVQVWVGRGSPESSYVDNSGELPTLVWNVPAGQPDGPVEFELWSSDGTELTLGRQVCVVTVESEFRLLQTLRSGESSIRIRWESIPGRSYRVTACDHLDSREWLNVGDPVTATESTTSTEIPTLPAAHRFYRVTLLGSRLSH